MPRKAPSNVTEHRVTLGNYERQQLEEYLDDLKTTQTISAVGNALSPFGELLGYAGLGVGIAFGLNTFQNQVMNDWWVRFTQERAYGPTGIYSEGDEDFNKEFITDNFISNYGKRFFNFIFGYERY